MKRLAVVTVMITVIGLTGMAVGAGPLAAAGPSNDTGLTVFVGDLTQDQFATLIASGIDRQEISTHAGAAADEIGVEVVLSQDQAAKLHVSGRRSAGKEGRWRDGHANGSTKNAAKGYTVFRSYSEPGGIKDEMEAVGRGPSGPGQARGHRAHRCRGRKSSR